MSTIITSILTGGTNSHATTSYEANAFATDFVSQGVNGTITNTAGVSPATGAFAVNAQLTPAMLVDVTLGTAYISATPASQAAQVLRAYMAANSTSYAISSNASGSTKYDWIYLKVDPTKAGGTEDSAGDDVTALYTSRSSSNSVDNNAPPTYGILLAIITVANGASSITNGNIADGRTQSALASPTGIVTSRAETTFDFVASGCVWTGDSLGATLNGSMTAGVAYIGGVRVSVPVQTANAFAASKDTYVYVSNAGTVSYSAQTNNAASPALPSNSILLGIIVTGSSNIADAAHINQGQENKIVPIASSIPYTVTDSNGNLICPRDANRKLLGYRQVVSSKTATTIAQVTGLSVPVIVPTGRKAKITFFARDMFCGSLTTFTVSIWDGVVSSGTQLSAATVNSTGTSTSLSIPAMAEAIQTPSSSSKTYNIGLVASTGTVTIEADPTYPAYIKVELE